MHEMSIAVALVEQASAVVLREGAARASRLRVVVGALSGVEPYALEAAFPVAAEGTPCEGAALDIVRVPAAVRCPDCGMQGEADFPFLVCPACASPNATVLSGRELLLESVEMESPAEGSA
jgi:hydrogenase nickel incorporation protein HypA/HybF